MKAKFITIALLFSFTINAQSLEEFHQEFYQSLCQRIISCADNVDIAENLMLTKITSKEACEVFFKKMNTLQQWQKPIQSKTAIFYPNQVKNCLVALSKSSCKSIAGRVTKPAIVPGCGQVITGTINDFEACDSQLSCKTSSASCYGSCQVPQLHCGEEVCGKQQFCDNNTTCKALKAVAQSCSNFSECENGNCIDGTCKAKRPVLKKGAACGGENSNICSIGEFCNDTNCIAFKKEGESCSTKWDDYKECEALLNCENNKCVKTQ